jgi:hypothetical protein
VRRSLRRARARSEEGEEEVGATFEQIMWENDQGPMQLRGDELAHAQRTAQ